MFDANTNWYTVDDSPNGRRYVYPAPTLPNVPDVRATLTATNGAQIAIVERHLLADRPLTTVTWRGRATTRATRHELRDAAAASPLFPPVVTLDEWTSRCLNPDVCNSLDYDDECTWCTSKHALYRTVNEDVPGEVHTHDYTHHIELPDGGLDQHLEHQWVTTDAVRALYPGFEHLRPGMLPDVWTHIGHALRALPHVTKVYTAGSEIAVYMRLPLSEPKEHWRDRIGVRGQKLKGREKIVNTSVEERVELIPVRGIRADTKADAVAKLEMLIADTVATINAYRIVVCTHCKGNGYTIPKPGTRATFTEAEMVAEAQRGLTPEQWKAKSAATQIALISSARARLEATGARLEETEK